MIAIAIACEPRLLLADEPTTSLDMTIQDQILSLLSDLQAENAMAMILVSHDFGVVARCCDDIAVMYAGHVVEFGSHEDVLDRPRHPYTQALLSTAAELEASTGRRQRLHAIRGQPPELGMLPEGCPFQGRCEHVRLACRQVTMELDRAIPNHASACPFVNAEDR
jgi:oligopeptide/dipeptide ABC transporter ATP-binding protein